MNLPYVGLTGVASLKDVSTLQNLRVCPPSANHCYMAGILVSGKTLSGQPTTNRRYPTVENAFRLAGLFTDSRFWVAFHYNNSGRKEPLREQLQPLTDRLGSGFGIQLNIARPPLDEVRELRDRFRLKIILQVNEKSLREPTAECMLEYVYEYRDVAEYALLDLSGGKGLPLNPTLAAKVLRNWDYPGIIPGLAGGLGPDASDTIWEVKARAPFTDMTAISYDAEGKIRVPVEDPIVGENYQDRLSKKLASQYVMAVHTGMKRRH